MGRIEERILLYHRLSLVFLAAFLLGLLICVVLFILLRIPEVVGYLTGWRARKNIRRLAEESGGPEPIRREEYPAEEAWDKELTALLEKPGTLERRMRN